MRDIWSVLVFLAACLICSLNCGDVSQQPTVRLATGDVAGAPGGAGMDAPGGSGGGLGGGRAGGAGTAASGGGGPGAGGGSPGYCGPRSHFVVQNGTPVCVPDDSAPDAGGAAGAGTGTGNTSGAH